MRKPGISRGIACPHGHDDWAKRKDEKFVCKVCERAAAIGRMRERRSDPTVVLFDTAKSRAAYLMVPFTITKEDIRAVWPVDGKCPVLGIDLKAGIGYSRDSSPTLDRINEQWGYEPNNIAVISHKANRAKGRLSAAELEKIATWMRAQGLD